MLFRFQNPDFTLLQSLSVGGSSSANGDTFLSVDADPWGNLVMLARQDGNGVVNSTKAYVNAVWYQPNGENRYMVGTANMLLGRSYADLSGSPNWSP